MLPADKVLDLVMGLGGWALGGGAIGFIAGLLLWGPGGAAGAGIVAGVLGGWVGWEVEEHRKKQERQLEDIRQASWERYQAKRMQDKPRFLASPRQTPENEDS